ncbi:sulfotransferase [Alicyclobacillus sp. ALC3]|uniref:sulfotransferase n=1 Tax=Alicyclobacillus sp. ALC3 TaxID=2796143 RepID=UPI002379D74C|nr:sulfotransferase [Alicyclobacillus sp. ALC3]WDL95237.1 sulfotransferase [Alicyclobacillus sp. ALC3]
MTDLLGATSSRMPRRPVFLHSGMRSGSSYLLNKFRMLDDTRCFYEPFSEELGRMSLDFLRNHGPKTWKSRHAPMDPYYLEYEPFMTPENHGIRGFDTEFTFGEYFRVTGDLSAQHNYLNSLLGLAGADGRQAVLGFCKSLGRLQWIREAFPNALHIVTVRDPVQQWLSGFHFWRETNNPYFLRYFQPMLANPGDNTYMQALLAEHPDLPYAEELRFDLAYEMFLHIYAITTIESVGMADLVVDMERMSRSSAYRDFMTLRIRELTGLSVDFSDCRISSHMLDAPFSFAQVNGRVLERLRNHLGDAVLDVSRPYANHPGFVLEKIEVSA